MQLLRKQGELSPDWALAGCEMSRSPMREKQRISAVKSVSAFSWYNERGPKRVIAARFTRVFDPDRRGEVGVLLLYGQPGPEYRNELLVKVGPLLIP